MMYTLLCSVLYMSSTIILRQSADIAHSLLNSFHSFSSLRSLSPSAAADLLVSFPLSPLRVLEPRKSQIYNDFVIPTLPPCQFNLNQFDIPDMNTGLETIVIVQHPLLVKPPAPAIASLCNCPRSRDRL